MPDITMCINKTCQQLEIWRLMHKLENIARSGVRMQEIDTLYNKLEKIRLLEHWNKDEVLEIKNGIAEIQVKYGIKE